MIISISLGYLKHSRVIFDLQPPGEEQSIVLNTLAKLHHSFDSQDITFIDQISCYLKKMGFT
jgi:hypothetical protein